MLHQDGPTITLSGKHAEPGWHRISLTIDPVSPLAGGDVREAIAITDTLKAELRAACEFILGHGFNQEFGSATVNGRRVYDWAATWPGKPVAEPMRLRGALARIVRVYCGSDTLISFGDDLTLAIDPVRVAREMETV